MTEIEVKHVTPVVRSEEKSSQVTPEGSLTIPASYDDAATRKLLRKLDMRCLPPIFILWFLSFIDRVNIGMARLGGLEKDLHMQGNNFNIALCIFFAPFVIFEVPANLVLKFVKPSVWLPTQNFLLALFTIGQGVVKTKEGLYAMRFMIGLFEAGLVPGSIFLLSAYYARFDLQWRLNMLLVGNGVASAFGGLLAYAITGLSGERGYLGWRWIFVIEGSITAVISLMCIFFVVDWPENAKWLNDHERAIIKARITEQAGDYKMNRLDGAAIKRCFLDWKVWLSTVIYIGTICSTYAINLFAPTFVKELNPTYTGRHVQALCIPIFLVSSLATLISAVGSDRLRHRYSFAMLGYLITLVGLIMFFCQKSLSPGARYAALYLVSIGTYITLPLIWTMCVNNVSGYYKTSVASAICVGFGNSGGIIASLVFTTKSAPYYWTGFRVDFACTVVAAALTTGLLIGLKAENRKRDKGGRDYRYNLPAAQVDNLGDDHPRFRFIY